MNDARRRKLRIAAVITGLISVATQGALAVLAWWRIDARLSCSNLLFWRDWIACLQGPSHRDIAIIEWSLAIWTIAAVGGALARFFSPRISALVPAAVAILVVIGLLLAWRDARVVQAESDVRRVLILLIASFFVMGFATGPAAAAWLWGVAARRPKESARLSAVFE